MDAISRFDLLFLGSEKNYRRKTHTAVAETISVAPPAEPRGEKKTFFVQILGGEKLLEFGEKWAVKTF